MRRSQDSYCSRPSRSAARGNSRTWQPTAASSGARSNAARCNARRCLDIKSSASKRAMSGARHSAMPACKAATMPPCAMLSTRTRESLAATRAANAPVSSCEPSSTTTHSQSRSVCRCTLRSAAPSVAAASKAGIRTETAGTTASLGATTSGRLGRRELLAPALNRLGHVPERAALLRELIGNTYGRPRLDMALHEAASLELFQARRQDLRAQASRSITQLTKATRPCLKRSQDERAPRPPQHVCCELERTTPAIDRLGHTRSVTTSLSKRKPLTERKSLDGRNLGPMFRSIQTNDRNPNRTASSSS